MKLTKDNITICYYDKPLSFETVLVKVNPKNNKLRRFKTFSDKIGLYIKNPKKRKKQYLVWG